MRDAVQASLPAWRLFSTLGCHLCEEAAAVLGAEGLQAEECEIADSDAWLQRYGLRIPVLQCVATGAELDWPFDRVALRAFVGRQPAQ